MPTDFDFFNERYRYDPETGHLHHRRDTNARGGRKRAGDIAGSYDPKTNRIIIGVQRDSKHRTYRAHRVAWLLMTGEWPEREIDHADTNAANNKWSNLRLATRGQNQCNLPVSTRNRLGLKGVSRHGRSYRGQIEKDGKHYSLPARSTPEEAHEDYLHAARELHGEFMRG